MRLGLLVGVQYFAFNIDMVCGWLHSVVVWHCTDWFYPYPSGWLHWHGGDHMIAQVTDKHMWRIWENTKQEYSNPYDIYIYPVLGADSRFWLANIYEAYTRISRLKSSAWDIKRKQCYWWRHSGDHDHRHLFLPLRCDRVTLCLHNDLGQIKVISDILKLQKHFRMWQKPFEHAINSLPLVCFCG